jgi:hypothetical protein
MLEYSIGGRAAESGMRVAVIDFSFLGLVEEGGGASVAAPVI